MATLMNWWEYAKLHPKSYLTDQEHTIIVKKESIPIVFVPGIMGSRLKRNGQRVWDPNDLGFTLKTYALASPEQRQQLLGSPGLDVDNDQPAAVQGNVSSDTFQREVGGSMGMAGFSEMPSSMQQQILNKAEARGKDAFEMGWGGIAWNFYGNFLQTLSSHDWSPFSKVFTHPVYAVAYNWTQDNAISGAYLAGKIGEIIAREQGKGRICEKVVVISHSMGGLVSRAAAKLSAAEGDVFDIVHGAQPVLGAPAAYRRIRAGFESTWWPESIAMSRVLGPSSADVLAVLGHSVGGLELLPNSLYKTNHGEPKWLKMTKDGLELAALPSDDPYASIYEERKSFLRLAYHPEYIDPSALSKASRSTSDPYEKAIGSLINNLRVAKLFHQNLGMKSHAITYSSWVGGRGLKTWDRIEYRYLRQHMEPYTSYGMDGMPTYVDTNPSEGRGTDYWSDQHRHGSSGYYEILAQDGKGDGTVPESSGGALKTQSNGLSKKLNYRVIESVEHGDFFNDSNVQRFAIGCVMEMTKEQFDKKMG